MLKKPARALQASALLAALTVGLVGCLSPPAAPTAPAEAPKETSTAPEAAPKPPPEVGKAEKPLEKPAAPQATVPKAEPTQVKTSGLEYVEVITGGASADDTLPLVIAVHGLGDRPKRFQRLARSYTGKARFIVPRAPEPYQEGFSWFPLARPLQNPPKTVIEEMKRNARRLATLIDEVKAKRPTRGKPVILGFSQGGLMSYLVATQHPERVAVALPVSGWLPDPLQPTALPTNTPRIRALHGEADTLIPEKPTRAMVGKLAKLGFEAELKSWPGVPHTISRPMLKELFGYLDEALASKSQ